MKKHKMTKSDLVFYPLFTTGLITGLLIGIATKNIFYQLVVSIILIDFALSLSMMVEE